METQEMMGQEIGRKWHFQQGTSKRTKVHLREGGDSKEGAGTRRMYMHTFIPFHHQVMEIAR